MARGALDRVQSDPPNYPVLVMVERKASETRTPLVGEHFGRRDRAGYSGHGAQGLQAGRVGRRQGKLEEAVGHFREAIRIAPDYLFALNDLGASSCDSIGWRRRPWLSLAPFSFAPSSYSPRQNLPSRCCAPASSPKHPSRARVRGDRYGGAFRAVRVGPIARARGKPGLLRSRPLRGPSCSAGAVSPRRSSSSPASMRNQRCSSKPSLLPDLPRLVKDGRAQTPRASAPRPGRILVRAAAVRRFPLVWGEGQEHGVPKPRRAAEPVRRAHPTASAVGWGSFTPPGLGIRGVPAPFALIQTGPLEDPRPVGVFLALSGAFITIVEVEGDRPDDLHGGA